MKSREQVEDQRQQNADDNASPQREVDGDILAPPCEVAGQVAKGNPQRTEEVDNASSKEQQQAEGDENARESGHPLQITTGGVRKVGR